jgi:hypothetical protein
MDGTPREMLRIEQAYVMTSADQGSGYADWMQESSFKNQPFDNCGS